MNAHVHAVASTPVFEVILYLAILYPALGHTRTLHRQLQRERERGRKGEMKGKEGGVSKPFL